MTVLLAFAFLSGVVTILSPCILPLLPIVLSGGLAGGKARPFGIVAGFVVSFTIFTLALTAIVQTVGVSPDALRITAAALIGLFGLVLIIPRFGAVFELLASRVARLGGAGSVSKSAGSGARPASEAGSAAEGEAGSGRSRARGSGFAGGALVGVSLGLVWTPCVGPIMASVVGLALTQRVDGGAVFITLAYTLGTSIPMLAVMFGGRTLLNRVPALTRNTGRIQKGFGVLMVAVGLMIGLGWDQRFQNAVLRAFPGYGSGLTAVENVAPVRDALQARGSLAGTTPGSNPFAAPPKGGRLGDYGPAPAIVTNGRWYNTEKLGLGGEQRPVAGSSGDGGSPALTMEELRGKVVLVDFWTYSCVNCVRTLPFLRAWYHAYKDQGLVIIGVHTPEFEFEKNPANVARAIEDLGVDWPVVLDNDYLQWRAYHNRYWPAHYFIDAQGRIRYFHFGEGEYETSERVIRALLREAGASPEGRVSRKAPVLEARTPETYLGYSRSERLVSETPPAHDRAAEYGQPPVPSDGEWSLGGTWTIAEEYIVPSSSGTLELRFNARNVFLVVQPQEPGGEIRVEVDGEPARDTADVKGGIARPTDSRLYQLVGLNKAGSHLLQLEVKGNLRLFAFTFG
jgi:cytochrome c biogenesis protein CcdA/thiol-disulfide isomerase/thioredoxin